MKSHVTLLLLLVGVVSVISLPATSKLFQRHLRSPPPGQTMDRFSKLCEYCGEVFGTELTYKCLFDPTFSTYKNCVTGLAR